MALLVQKFGGSSLATLEHINRAADLVSKAKQAGHDVVVIVSAMQGDTDKLINLAHQMSESPDDREYAALVATGEQVSMALMALALLNRGISARSYTGSQARIHTTSQYTKARISSIETQPILDELANDTVVVIAGFQGMDKDGNITTFGRGGSDTTAVAIAAALKADECQIYTDVDGVYTTDPRVEPNARRLDQVTFEEMLELASLGAKVLQIHAVEFAGKYKVPLRVLSSLNGGEGTLITYQREKQLDSPQVAGIAFCRNEAKISLSGLPDSPDVVSTILSEFSSIGVNVDMFIQHVSSDNRRNFTFSVHQNDYTISLKRAEKIASDLGAYDVVGVENLSKLSLVGTALSSHPDIAPKMFKTLALLGINIQLIATSEIKISVIIDETRLDEGVRALHHAFQLAEVVLDESTSRTSTL